MNQRIKKIIFISVILFVGTILCSSKALARTIDTNIDGIDENLYPRNESCNKINASFTS